MKDKSLNITMKLKKINDLDLASNKRSSGQGRKKKRMIITITGKKKKRNYELRSTRMFLEHLLCGYACNRWLRNGKNIKSSSAIEMMDPLGEKTCI